MASLNLATLLVKLKADTGRYKREMKGAGKNTSKFGDVASKALAGAVAGGFIAATAAAAKFANDSVKEFEEFEKASAEVFTLMPDLTEDAMSSMRADVLDFGADVGRTTDETVPALYQAISAGVPRENVFDFMQIASDAALGGVTDLETAVDGITSVVNAYGEEAVDAQEASDLLFTAVKLGKTTFDELSGSVADVTPIAAALGVEFGDVTAALAAMTSQGTSTNVATTQLRSLLQELSKSGTEVNQVFQEVAGVGFSEFIAQGNSLGDALALIESQSEKTGVPIQDMFANIRAGLGALQLTGDGAEVFSQNLKEMESSSGATSEAAETMAGTLEHTQAQVDATTESMKIQVGEALEPGRKAWLELKLAVAEAGTAMARQVNINRAAEDVVRDYGDQIDTTGELIRVWNEQEKDHAVFMRAVAKETQDANAEMLSQERQVERVAVATDLLEHGFSGSSGELQELINRFEGLQPDVRARLMEEYAEAQEFAAQTTGLLEGDLTAADLRMVKLSRSTEEATDQAHEYASSQEAVKENLLDTESVLDKLNKTGRETSGVSSDMSREARLVTEEYAEQRRKAEEVEEATRQYEQALQGAEDALGSYFEQALEGKDVNEDLLEQFLSLAAQQGANAEELRTIATATGNYNQKQIDAAVSSAMLQTEFQKLTIAWQQGKITADQATQAIQFLESGERATADAAINLATTMSGPTAEALHGAQANALNTKLQVDGLNTSLDSVPEVVPSAFEDEDTYHKGFLEADRLLQKLNALDGKSTKSTHTTVFETQGQASGAPGHFQSGGFTGGTAGQPAGIVHGQEFVFSAPAVRNIGVRALEFLHSAARGGGGQGAGGVGPFYIDARGAQRGVGSEIKRAVNDALAEAGLDADKRRRV